MESTNRFTVDGIIDDELSPDFEELEADYFEEVFSDEFEEELDDEDTQYFKETQDEGFLDDLGTNELDF